MKEPIAVRHRVPSWARLMAFALCCLMGGSARYQAAERPGVTVGGDGASILTTRLRLFSVGKADMAGALSALVTLDRNIVIGFEQVPAVRAHDGVHITISLKNESAEHIVRRLCLADPRYEYSVIDGQMIEVRPKGAIHDPKDLLNTRVRDYRVDGDFSAAQLIENITEDAPELGYFLRRSQEQRAARTGRASGSPGSIISGNMSSPRFTLHIRNATVRQILDAISLRSIEMFRDGKNFGPTGWEYVFVVRPDAPTGLGGYPRWSAF